MCKICKIATTKKPRNAPKIGNYHVQNQNKYAIHAYTHGPVTGSGPSVV